MCFERLCTICRDSYPPSAESCPKCGEQLVFRWIECSVCGLVNEAYEDVCERCGEPLRTGKVVANNADEHREGREPETNPAATLEGAGAAAEPMTSDRGAKEPKRGSPPTTATTPPAPQEDPKPDPSAPERAKPRPIVLKPKRRRESGYKYSQRMAHPEFQDHLHPSRYAQGWEPTLQRMNHPYHQMNQQPPRAHDHNYWNRCPAPPDAVRSELKSKVQSIIMMKDQRDAVDDAAPSTTLGSKYERQRRKRPPVVRPSEPSEREDERPSAAPTECQLCMGAIADRAQAVVCQCGNKYHRSCIEVLGRCPNCGRRCGFQPLEIEK